ncbi:MAG: dihydrolipoamide acetyltransferase family protein [Candidatus Dormibacteria bacterium]
MSTEFRMPDIGEGIAEVEIIEWHVGVGEQIRADQIVATIETAKAVVEMPTPLTGTVVSLGAEPGGRLPVGGVLITVEGIPGGADPSPAAPAAVVDQDLGSRTRPAAVRPKAAPAVRRFAVEHGVELQGLRGSGPGGRITREDVLEAEGSNVDAPQTAGDRGRTPGPPASTRDPGLGPDGADQHVPLRGLRREIAKAMVESWQSVPHIIDYRDVDAARLVEARAALREAWPQHAAALTFVPLFVKVAATALRRHPIMNASFDAEAAEYVLHRRVHIGVATATADGLLVPVVRDADRKSILELALEIAELVELARTRKATIDHLRGGTYTVNNFGAIGASMGTPIIRTPEVGITGFGRIADRVVARGGLPVVRPMLTVSSVGDHRLHDGDTLGAFTSTLVRLLEAPYELLAELA